MREQGIARATTKQIAAAAGCSEALLYKHFRAKVDLFVAVLQERTPGELAAFLVGLRDAAGKRSVEENLVQVAQRALAFYRESFLMAVSIFFEREAFEAYRAALLERGAGPQMVNRWLADYLRAEQELGRVRADAAPDAAASLLFGACMQHAFLGQFVEQPEAVGHARSLVRMLLPGLVAEGDG
ncbi:TetR/AcrR family transcriptional regulator [Myceligenerans sp. TRM 65318]|uniref:TetR/AcrR family transcriptional regulator n=2 Tax=Myceligenerans pegani TaxID=2776917 RepID=A0ABR9MTQ4_9MICO|nr:TetR/AcrR family transcriptional regulator [Myceligenerans sp. TRM 65318]MBE3017027.1 TetR/AcrR family transcriptional regulator [Myceligenerans sp. TRM 65318]